MSKNERVNEFQTKVQETIQSAQRVLETLADRAQAEVKLAVGQARTASRAQLGELGKELIRLGERLQKLSQEQSGAASPSPESVN